MNYPSLWSCNNLRKQVKSLPELWALCRPGRGRGRGVENARGMRPAGRALLWAWVLEGLPCSLGVVPIMRQPRGCTQGLSCGQRQDASGTGRLEPERVFPVVAMF